MGRGSSLLGRYWFDDGGRVALACVRIAVALSVLWTLLRIGDLPDALVPPAAMYRPVGPWLVLGSSPPSPGLVDALWVLAWAGTGAMLLGLASRIATIVSFVTAVALAALVFSDRATWSHQYNVVFLAQLALAGGRTGDALSLDALIRRLRGRPPCVVPHGYQWSLRLAQIAVALMFAGAAFFKLAQGHFTLRWALSDSLRHHLLVRYDLAGLERPPVVDWLIDSVWRYRAVALLNLGTQLAPLAAVIWARRPWIRAGAGVLFVMEVLGLGLVVDLWNPHWLPLVAVFIDWDALAARLGHRAPAAGTSAGPSRAVKVWIAVFVVYDALCSFVPMLAQRARTFPFTSFPMFSQVRANPPYDEHRPYAVPGDRFEAITDQPITPQVAYFLDHVSRGVHTVTTGEQLRARLTMIFDRARTRYPEYGWRGLRHRLALFVAPAYPAPAHFEEHPIAITGEVLADGTVRRVLGRWTYDEITLEPVGLTIAPAEDVTFVAYANDSPEPIALSARRTGPLSWTVTGLDADPVYVVAIIAGTPWLATWRRSWRW